MDHIVLVSVCCPLAEVDGVEFLDALQILCRKLLALRNNLCAEEVLHALRSLAVGKRNEFLDKTCLQSHLTLFEFLVHLLKLKVCRLALLLLCLCIKVGLNNHTLQRRRCLQRRILHIAGLVTEDGTEKFFLRRRVALALRCDLTDKDVARHNVCAHTDNSALVEILCSVLADVWNV